MGLPMYEEMDNVITLGGVIKEFGLESYFEVSVDKNESVYTLKEKILEKNKVYQDRFSANNLKVWLVNVAKDSSKLDDIKHDSVSVESILAGSQIRSIYRIKDHFKNSDKRYVHFVVQGVENWCSLCIEEFVDIVDHFFERGHITKNGKLVFNIIDVHNEEPMKIDDETVVEEKPIYKSNWEYDEKEGDNVLCNSGEYPDPDD